jgi:hypothetical protein
MDEPALREALHRADYIADDGLATALWLAGELQRPLLIDEIDRAEEASEAFLADRLPAIDLLPGRGGCSGG